jgi:hypothetical protein
MADNPRRRFLKASAGAISGLALGSCTDEQAVKPSVADSLDLPTLEALGRIVLPRTALGDTGVTRAIDEFLTWLDGFEPVSERDHSYDSVDVLYGPPHPAPLWKVQLEALTIEATKRFAAPYTEISETRQREILERQLPGYLPEDMPYAGAATHVAIGLIAWFYATREANDLALQAKIGRQTCRGLESGPDKPAPTGS